MSYHIALAQPHNHLVHGFTQRAVAQCTRRHYVSPKEHAFGDISHNFNVLWASALNERAEAGYTHFAMVHADINPQDGWLDALLDEMDRVDADILSVVIAIKDNRGLTSTGIRRPGSWGCRRLCMTEIMALPPTFCAADLAELEPDVATGHAFLAINTGLWVCRLPGAGWPDAFPGFSSRHRLAWRDHVCYADFDSEDWRFSEWAANQGLRVFATRAVYATHHGDMGFPNDSAWGSWTTEQSTPLSS